MRRAALLALVAALGLAAPATAEAASWAQPQIRIVVREGVMGPSVTAFRPQDPLTRAALARALTAFTGVAHTTAQPARTSARSSSSIRTRRLGWAVVCATPVSAVSARASAARVRGSCGLNAVTDGPLSLIHI